MSNKHKHDPNKPKEFTISNAELAEITHLHETYAVFQDTAEFWRQRIIQYRVKLCNTHGISIHSYEVDWSKVFSDGKFFAIKKKEAPPVKVNPVEEKNPATPSSTPPSTPPQPENKTELPEG